MDSTLDASRIHPALFWGCLLFLNGALLLPSLVSYRPPASSWLLATDGAWPTSLIHRPEVDLLRISVDVVLLLALAALTETPIDSLYYTYDNLQLTDPPDIYLFMVESYGNVLATHPELQDSYYRLMRETESILASESWHMATGSRIHCRAGT